MKKEKNLSKAIIDSRLTIKNLHLTATSIEQYIEMYKIYYGVTLDRRSPYFMRIEETKK